MNKFRNIILRETKGIIPKAPSGFFYLFYSRSCELTRSSVIGKLLDGKAVSYTEARSHENLDSSTSYSNDTRFIGIGKYDSKNNNHY